jgi:hypothetical protein
MADPTTTFKYDADNEAFLKKLSQSEAVNKRVQDAILRDAEKARVKERIAQATEADVMRAFQEKAAAQRLKNANKAAELIYQFKKKENDKLLKLEQKRLADEARLQEKARVEAEKRAAKAAASKTFSGKAKAIQQSSVISEAETIASLGITAGGSISKLSLLAASAIRPLALLGAGISSLGPAGIAAAAGLAAIAAPVAGLVVASKVIYALSDSAVEAEQRLREMGLSAEIPEESRAAVVAYKAAQTELAVEMDKLSLILGTKMIPYAITMTNLTRGLVGVTEEYGGTVVWLGGVLAQSGLDTYFPKTALALKAGAPLWDGLTSAVGRYAESVNDLPSLDEFGMGRESELTPQDLLVGKENQAKLDEIEGTRQQKIADEKARKAKEALTEAQRRETEAFREAKDVREALLAEVERGLAVDKEVEAGIRRMLATRRELNREWDVAAGLDTQTMIAAKTTQINDYLRESDTWWQRIHDGVETAAASVQGLNRDTDESTSAVTELGAKWMAAAGNITDFASEIGNVLGGIEGLMLEQQARWQQQGEDQIAQAEENAQRLADITLQQIDDDNTAAKNKSDRDREQVRRLRERGKLSEQQAKAQLRQIDKEERERAALTERRISDTQIILDANTEAAQKEAAAERAAVAKSFKATQALAKTQAIINAAASAVALTASLAYLGFGAPIAAATIAGSMLAVQLTTISRQKAPEFPMGRAAPSPDHMGGFVQPDEGVASRRAMMDESFRRELDARNKGVDVDRDDSTQIVEVRLRTNRRGGLTFDRRARRNGKRVVR